MDDISIADETRTNEATENKLPEVEVSFDDLMARIRHIVLTSRLRVSYFYWWLLICLPFVLFKLFLIFQAHIDWTLFLFSMISAYVIM